MQSLKKSFMFKAVYNAKSYAADRYYVLYVLENGLEYNRLGVSVGKKVGKSVVRNKIKRYIKEGFRLVDPSCVQGYDLVFLVRAPARDADYHLTFKSISSLLNRKHIL